MHVLHSLCKLFLYNLLTLPTCLSNALVALRHLQNVNFTGFQ